jgi:hypothetical protein
MPRFFFHFRQLSDLTIDEYGCEFSNVEDAYLSAFRAAQEMWHELLIERQDPRCCSFEVADGEGNALFVLPFTEVLDSCTQKSDRHPKHYAHLLHTALNNQQHALRLRGEVSAELKIARTILTESISLLAQLSRFE